MPENVWALFGMLAAVGGILVLAYATTRLVAGGKLFRLPGNGENRFRVLAQLNLGKSERLLLVELGERCLLLGVTAYSVQSLLELSPEEAAQWTAERETGAAPAPGFLEALQKNWQRKK